MAHSWIKHIVTDALSVNDRCFKEVITCLKCQRLLTQVTASAKSQKQQRVIGMLYLWHNVLIGTPTLFSEECVHPSFWGSQDWFRHSQGSIIKLYSAALTVRQHKRHIGAAQGQDIWGRMREERSPRSCGVLLTGRCVAMLSLTYKVKDQGDKAPLAAHGYILTPEWLQWKITGYWLRSELARSMKYVA